MPRPYANRPKVAQEPRSAFAAPLHPRRQLSRKSPLDGPQVLTPAQLKRLQNQAKAEQLAQNFLALLAAEGIAAPIREHRFHAARKWAFDFAWTWIGGPAGMTHRAYLALEVEGGVWTRGRHTRGLGFVRDMEKYSEAALAGWCVIRVTPDQLCEPETLAWIRRGLTR